MAVSAELPPAALLRLLFDAAVERAHALDRMASTLPERPRGRTIVVGAGKAAAAMARTFERAWQGPLTGLIVTPYGHGCPCRQIEVIEAGHPVPDEAGLRAAKRMLELVGDAGADDLVVFLISGGGSALLPAPAPGLTLSDEQDLARALLVSGAPIADINVVRRHISAIKGGRLAQAAAPARTFTYVVSDIPGDDPRLVASGPTFADPSTRSDAVDVLDRYGIEALRAWDWLASPESETPKDLHSPYVLLATAADALKAAGDLASRHGYAPVLLGDAIEGEARDVAREQAALVSRIRQGIGGATPPCVLLSGGETTVTVRGTGRGGRNTEFALALALALDSAPGVHALAADTDGLDGSGDNAGAVVGPHTLAAFARRGIDAAAALNDNDGYAAFAAIDDLVFTGPTRTNVNDFRAILIEPF